LGLFFIAIVAGFFFPVKNTLKDHIDLSEYPTLGSRQAPVQMIVFEEPQCGACKNFHTQTLPLLKERFIDTGKVQCTLVLLSFIEDSDPLALASYAVFEQRPERFFPFLNELYGDLPEGNTGAERAMRLVERFQGIDVDQLKQALADGHLKVRIQKHEDLGWELMKDDFATPTVFINGVKTRSYSLGSVTMAIQKALKQN
jgi:protein-disulfide isomerase